jgi:hypothetical protein
MSPVRIPETVELTMKQKLHIAIVALCWMIIFAGLGYCNVIATLTAVHIFRVDCVRGAYLSYLLLGATLLMDVIVAHDVYRMLRGEDQDAAH